MIQKIGQIVNAKSVKSSVSPQKSVTSNISNNAENPINTKSVSTKELSNYYNISFGARKVQDEDESPEIDASKGISKRQKVIESAYTDSANDLVKSAAKIAKQYGAKEINELHLEKATLEYFANYLNDVEAGVKSCDEVSSSLMPIYFSRVVNPKIISDSKERAKVKPIIQDEIKNIDDKLKEQQSKNKAIASGSTPKKISEKLVYKVWEFANDNDEETDKFVISDTDFLDAMFYQDENIEKNPFKKFVMKLSDAVMVDIRPKEELVHLATFEDKAKNILKNLSLGTNMVITYDNKSAKPTYLVDTLAKVFDDNKLGLENLDKSNAQMTIFNGNLNQGFLGHKIKEMAKDKTKKHIVVFDFDTMILNGVTQVADDGTGTKSKGDLSNYLTNILKDTPKNIKLVMVEAKGAYYNNSANPLFQPVFENFGEISVNALNVDQTIHAFMEQPKLMSKIEIPFSNKALRKVVETSTMLDGVNPDKTQKLMKKIATYYAGKKEIDIKDVQEFVEQAKETFKANSADSSLDVVLDTGKKLKDVLGKDATKKEAESYIKQIKSKKMGAKGAIIYSQDGSVGSGRKFIAKVIAGETKSPYIELNAMDFGAPTMELLSTTPVPTEKAIKQLGALIKTHAEASPYKSAVVAIENFEWLPFGENVSEYYPKSMAQLLREMESLGKKGLNILFLGSVNDSETADACSDKVLKFNDRLEVESPSRNIDARKEILPKVLKEKGIKLDAALDAERAELINSMAETTEGFPYSYMKSLADKLKMVTFERGHKKTDETDFVEAYLQLTTGRPSSKKISDFEKQITTSHEKQHGLNLYFMRKALEKKNIPWVLPDKVNFLTLDPRSWFYGMMSAKFGGNEEDSFEKLFSELVMDFGGYSAEKCIYNLQGPGLDQDLNQATRTANIMVTRWAQGQKYGLKSIAGMSVPPSEITKQNIESDVDVLLKNAAMISDLMTKGSMDFDKIFNEKYSPLVGTGKCIVSGKQFEKEIEEWIDKSDAAKKLEALYDFTLETIKHSKEGHLVDISAEIVPKTIKEIHQVLSYIK